MIRRQKYQLFKSVMNFVMGSICLVIFQGQKLWQSSPRKHQKNTHRTSIIPERPEINYKRFRDGRRTSSIPHISVRRNQSKWPDQWLMSIFLFFHTIVLTKLNLRGFVNTVCKEHREPESINNLQFTLAEFACSNSLASSRQNAGSS